MRYLKKKIFKSKVEEIDSEGTWAISYGDILTLLLSFFVVFFTTDFRQQKIDKLNRYLVFDIDNAKDLGKGETSKKSYVDMKISQMNEFLPTTKESENYIVVSFGAHSFFDSGSVDVKKEAEKVLQDFAQKYVPYVGKYQLSIKGFTDNRPVLKKYPKFADNLELSALRAIAAMRILQKSGIPLNRMEIAGLGELETINKTLSEHGEMTKKEREALSRKIVLVIKPVKESFM